MEKHDSEAKNRLLTEFGLLAGEDSRGPAGPCPDAEELAALVDGRFGGARREALLEHLVRCPACREAWITATAVVPPRADKAKMLFLRRPAVRYGLPLAMAACLLLFLMTPGQSPVPTARRALDNAFVLAERGAVRTRGRATAPPPAPAPQSAARKAYLAGTMVGVREAGGPAAPGAAETALDPGLGVTTPTGWNDTPQAPYYLAGRYAGLLWGACAAVPPDTALTPGVFQSPLPALLAAVHSRLGNESEAEAFYAALKSFGETVQSRTSLPCATAREAIGALEAGLPR